MSETKHGSPELDADAEKLIAQGADPGPEFRDLECPVCGGEGSWEVLTGGYDPRDGSPNGYIQKCEHCGGRGGLMQEVEPITIEDLANE